MDQPQTVAPLDSATLGNALPPRWRESLDSIKNACDGKSLGEIVAANQKMILDYYQDVQKQARMSFVAAWAAAVVGFGVLIASLAYAMIRDSESKPSSPIVVAAVPSSADSVPRALIAGESQAGTIAPSHILAAIGVASGIIIEFIAFVSFRLYGQASRQFGTFHICLERTNRYLIAYKVSEKIAENKDQTLHDLVCIMANAPMITQRDIDSADLMIPRTPASDIAKRFAGSMKV